MTLTAANEFVASWVKNRYTPAIVQALQAAAGREIELRIIGNPCTPETAKCPALRLPERQYLPMTVPLPVMHESGAVANPTPWRFCFQDFVVGPCNELAYSAAQSICRRQLLTDQFFLCSSPGLGKTHLLQAIGKEMSTNGNWSGPPRVVYLSAEEFACRMVMALKRRDMESFKGGLRDRVDVLLLEDIHFLQGKEKTQEELLATVKSLRAMGKKIIFTSSFLPKELPDLDCRLASQFCDGFMAVIEKPDFETRVRILEYKAKSRQVQIPRDVTEILAGGIRDDIRLLESCLQNLVIKARIMNQSITRDLALEILQNYTTPQDKLDLQRITRFICQSFSLADEKLRCKCRKKTSVLARNAIFYLARKHTDLSLKAIGEAFNRKHSTVLKGITHVEREIARQSPGGRQIHRLIQTLELSS